MKLGGIIWHSSRINEENAEVAEFATPQAIRTRANYFSVMPATSRGFLEVMQYGEDLDSTWTAIANDRVFHGKVKEGDLFWLDGEIPPLAREISDDYGYAESATAVVKSVSYVNHTISITLTRNKEQVKQ